MGKFTVVVKDRADQVRAEQPMSCTIVDCIPAPEALSCTITGTSEALSCTISNEPAALTSCTISSEPLAA